MKRPPLIRRFRPDPAKGGPLIRRLRPDPAKGGQLIRRLRPDPARGAPLIRRLRPEPAKRTPQTRRSHSDCPTIAIEVRSRRIPDQRPGDRGAASILLLAIGLVLVAAGLAGAMVANARVARHQARTAADFGALAGAPYVIEGEEPACAEAARLVVANGAVVEYCRVEGLEIVVQVTVTTEHVPRPARAAARAGPLSAEG
jgi:secretion/DNA translocation related TadE-like protein